ncbi:hypothetical protein VQ207_000306 [Salmonella enterica]|nr:hypothetical protein [Salmonella enterica]EMD4040760.1 hypothetical protein [Salmonella enterica]EMD4226090.1 hypothetical protein [Salmonella enterica]EMD4271368.1 hypothetical protein [Salmonella enterica]EMD6053152.1 hypothetical protein [Salmonella enterica]
MAYWLSEQLAQKVDGTKWNVFDIPNGYVPARAGNVIARNTAWGNRWVNMVVVAGGMIVARKQNGDNWGATINAFIPAGEAVTVSVDGDGGLEWFKFMEF